MDSLTIIIRYIFTFYLGLGVFTTILLTNNMKFKNLSLLKMILCIHFVLIMILGDFLFISF
jgi:hypothetical protein